MQCTYDESIPPTGSTILKKERARLNEAPAYHRMAEAKLRKIAFLSSCPEAWGGSEELWGGTALRLAQDGHTVHAFKTLIDFNHQRIRLLQEANIPLWDYWALPIRKREYFMRRFIPRDWLGAIPMPHFQWVRNYLRTSHLNLVVISMGENFDGLEFVDIAIAAGVPYAIICQKASDLHWPADIIRGRMRNAYIGATQSYFVSRHNRELTERQIGVRLLNAEVIANPYMTPVEEPLPWPETTDGIYRLACVARLFVLEKGQDILLEVLSRPKWRERPLRVSLFGKGIHDEGLREATAYLRVNSIDFAGFVSNVTDIWRTHHAVILPSRAEGLPLSLIEAMFCGRLGIVTKVGGNTDVITEGKTGFLATGADPDALDDAMERAWERRDEWKAIGCAAAASVREWLPADPCADFKHKLLGVCARKEQ